MLFFFFFKPGVLEIPETGVEKVAVYDGNSQVAIKTRLPQGAGGVMLWWQTSFSPSAN